MSNAAEVASPNGGKGFFRTFKDTFFWTVSGTSVSRVSHRSEEAEGTNSPAKLIDGGRPDVSDGSFSREDEEDLTADHMTDPSLSKSKSKNKLLKKKKEIISSSTAVPRVEICTGKKCKARGSEQLLSDFQASSAGRVEIAHTTCMKACKQGMNVRVTKDGITFDMHNEVSVEDCQQILCKHFEW